MPDYRWNLRNIMAARGMFSTTELRPLLSERGVNLSPSQVYRLVVERPERLSLKVLVSLIDILGCRMDELIEPVVAEYGQRVAGDDIGSKKAPDSSLGQLRPKRARITGEDT
nr:helix-turn-helix transcriptional regulator [Mycobacteroides abscessus]